MKKRIQFNEYSLWTRKKYDYDWYEWCVFMDESKETISTVARVQYLTSPQFS